MSDILQEQDLFLEKVLPDTSKKLSRYGIDVAESPEHVKGNMYFDFSALDNLSPNQFKSKFFDLCKDMDTYNAKIIIIPVDYWIGLYGKIFYLQKGNPVSNLIYLLANNLDEVKKNCKDYSFIFLRNSTWFALNINAYTKSDRVVLIDQISALCADSNRSAAATGTVKSKPITTTEIKERNQNQEDKKKELVEKITDVAATAGSEEDYYDYSDTSEIIDILNDIEDNEYGKPKFSTARATRMTKVNNDFVNKSGKSGRSVKELIENPESKKELPSSNLKVASINDEWKDIKFINFNKEYEIDDDIRLILESFSDKEYPIVVRSIETEDTSTSEDYVITYRVGMEDMTGKQFTIVFDIPKFINNRFMRLRGNDKVISGQLFNLPCTKTSADTVQVVSNYRKIMISRFGATGKSYPISDRLIKTLSKYDGHDIKVSYGDNRKTCSKYELPVDYIDFAMQYNWIDTPTMKFVFDQDFYYNNYAASSNNGTRVPIAINKSTNDIIYAYPSNEQTISEVIADLILSTSKGLLELYNSQKPANKHTYSRASIMSSSVPLVVVICTSIPFKDLLKRANINYSFSDKRVKYDPDKQGCIKFYDGYLIYDITYSSSMLLNGLLDCDTESYRFVDLNKKATWLDYLDNFGGRIIADGLDNFKEVFMDPITKEVCRECKIPDDYIDILIYANSLLADNKYIKHTDLASNRYRTTEIVAGHLYQVLAGEYIRYRQQARQGRKKSSFSVKKSAVIDAIFANPVTSDLSSMSPLLELEANNSATFKGLSGLNSDRAYSLDKRTYDESMVGKLALSTGFSTNVGINRQTTMDMDVMGKRGYIKTTSNDEKSITKRMSSTEAVTPFGSTRDDPFRSAMTYIQTSKHSMPTNKSMPLLVTNGADEAMSYMVSENYVIRAEDAGEVLEIIPNDHMVIKYTAGPNKDTGKYISLKEETRKNSDGGFFITIKFTTDIKNVGHKFKKDDILAYDEKSFSNRNGEVDNIAYDVGVLAYAAIMATDEGYEDSTSISRWMSEALGSEVAAQSDVELGKMANILSIVKEGQEIQEGDPLIVFQNSFDEEDANILLKNITDSDFVSDLGRIKIKAKYTGIVQDIKIYRTCEIEELSDSLQKIVKEHDGKIKRKKTIYKKFNIPGENMLEPDHALPPTGKLKNTNGVRIEFYIKYFDNMGIGDKLVAQSANKGVVRYIFPAGEEPYSSFDTTKTIHAVFSSRSFNARMVTSPIVSGAINKGLVNLDEQVKKIMGLDIKKLEDIQG